MEPTEEINPDDLTANGIAIWGHTHAKADDTPVAFEALPHSLGVKLVGGAFSPLLAKHTPIPTVRRHRFATVEDQQTAARLLVLSGEQARPWENDLLAELIVTGIRPAVRGEVEIEMTLEITSSGFLRASAADTDAPRAHTLATAVTSGRQEAQVRAIIAESAQDGLRVSPNDTVWAPRKACQRDMAEIDALLPPVRRALADAELGPAAIDKVGRILGRAHEAVESGAPERAERSSRALAHTVTFLRRVLRCVNRAAQAQPARSPPSP